MAWQIPRIFARASVFVLGMAMIAALTLGMPTSADARSAGAGPVVGHGPTWRGLSLRATGRCAGGFRIDGTGMCSHGPDTRLGLSRAHAATRRALAGAGPAAAAAATSVSCDGDGVSGARVQAIYAHGPSTASRYATLLQSLRGYAADVENVFLQSAEETGGVRRPRWVTDAQCQVSVIEVGLSANAESSFNQTITELQALGYDQPGRKYLIWFDAAVYCGIGTWWSDDQANQDNLSNTATGFARADASCWDWAEAHELMHTLGGV